MKPDAKKPTKNTNSKLKPQYDGTLRIGNTTLLPPEWACRAGSTSDTATGTIVEHFLRVDKTGQLLPHLIESWEYSEDGTQLTLKREKTLNFMTARILMPKRSNGT